MYKHKEVTMDIYRIADLDIGIHTRFDYTKEYLKDYLSNTTSCEFEVAIDDDMLAHEKQITVEKLPEHYYEITAILRSICSVVLEKYNGFFLHCSCFELDSNAYVITAKSGTGKSTHARLFRQYFGDKITMINDDKPIVRLIDNEFIIYGTPWNGKHSISNNIKAPIKAIFYLNRSKENKVERCDAFSAMTKLLTQTVLPNDKTSMNILLDMLEKLVSNTPVFDLYCDMSKDAVMTTYNTIKEL